MEGLEGGLVGREDNEEEFYSTDVFLNSIDEASQEVEVLEAMREVFSKYDTVDPQAVRIANIAIESVLSKFDLPRASLALESYSSKAEVLEGLGSAISTVINAIVATFKAIWNAIMSLFGSGSKTTVEDKIGKSISKLEKKKEVYVPKNPLVTTPLLDMLDFNEDKVVAIQHVQDRAREKLAEMKKLASIEEKGIKLSKTTLHSMKEFMAAPVGQEALSKFLGDGVIDFRDYQYNIKAQMHRDIDANRFKAQIENFESMHGIKASRRKTYSHLSPFLDNSVIVLCEIIDDSISYYHGLFVQDKTNTGVKLELPNAIEVVMSMVAIQEDVRKMFEVSEKKNKAIKDSALEDIVELIPKFMKFVETNYSSNASEIIGPFRAFASTFRESARNTRVFEKTARDFASLCEFISNNYIPAPD